MDLVASYSSDESESEADKECVLKITDKKVHTVNVDTGNLDVITVNVPNCFFQHENDKCNSLDNIKEEKTEFSIISDSESDNDMQLRMDRKSSNKSPQLSIFDKNPEKIDYLNLESSDTDEEQQTSQPNFVTLLNSAEILSDVECGPLRPNIDTIQIHETSSEEFVHKTLFHNKSKKRCKSAEPIAIKERTDTTLQKHFKSNSETIEPSLHVNEHCLPKEFIYREDERITERFSTKSFCQIPKNITKTYDAHSNIINALSWCIPQYSHLLLTASLDCSLKIWDIFSKNSVQTIKCSLGLKAAKWLHDGKKIAAGGYEKKASIFDVISGKEILQYDISNYLTSLEIHPSMEDVILCGTTNAVFAFDTRTNNLLPIRTFNSLCYEVLDIVFLSESEFACSTSIVSHDSADRTIMVWDFSSGALFSNQIFLERYTCPSLKVHPSGSSFVAQTNGDYIAYFSTSRPYKIQNKRCMGHKVSGFGVECDISFDGKYLGSGDAKGDIYFYDYYTSNYIRKLTAKSDVATNCLKWHPVLYSTMATATWDGSIQIWK